MCKQQKISRTKAANRTPYWANTSEKWQVKNSAESEKIRGSTPPPIYSKFCIFGEEMYFSSSPGLIIAHTDFTSVLRTLQSA